MDRNVRSCSFLTLVFLLGVLLAVNCTESCYKDESNYADAGDSSGSSSNDDGGGTADGCKVGDVYYQIDMTHPDKPCLVCTILDDNISIGWVPLEDGSWCDDGKFCTGEGTCDRGRCSLDGNPCPAEAPYCTEAYGGLCLDQPFDDDDADDDDTAGCWSCTSSDECLALFGEGWGCLDDCCTTIGDDDDADDDDTGGCWSCVDSAECMILFGDDWGCLDECCVQVGGDDDDDDDTFVY